MSANRPAKGADADWLIVGVMAKPHGVHGDVLVDITTDFPDRMREGTRFGLGPEDGPSCFLEVFKVRQHKGRWLLSVCDVRDRTIVEAWRGQYVFLPAQSRSELPEGYYYEHELQGLKCVSPSGDDLGIVVGVDSESTQPRLIVQRDSNEYLVPYVPQIVTNVDLAAGQVVIDALPGLLDEDSVEA
ncbi:MAG: 16S rRNA processing protein RimM [bacterium]|nr:16S rRNA processing protein RimM [bacterium]